MEHQHVAILYPVFPLGRVGKIDKRNRQTRRQSDPAQGLKGREAIVGLQADHEIQIASRPQMPVQDDSHAADHHILDIGVSQGLENFPQVE